MATPLPTPLQIEARVTRLRHLEGTPAPGIPLFGIATSTPLSPDDPVRQGDALVIVPDRLEDRSSPWGLALRIPEMEAVRGAIVIVAPTSKASFFTRLLGGERPLPRALRGAALLLKGYGAIAGGVDVSTKLDLIWGEALV